MLVKVGIRLEIQVVQLQIMEKQIFKSCTFTFSGLKIILWKKEKHVITWVYIEVLQLCLYIQGFSLYFMEKQIFKSCTFTLSTKGLIFNLRGVYLC